MKFKAWGIWGFILGLVLPGNSFSYGFPQDSVFPIGTVGCLFTNQLCGFEEVCVDDLLFGNCQRVDKSRDLHQYRLTEDELSALEEHILHLIKDGFTWRDYYTQCVLQNALLASRQQVPFRRSMCKLSSSSKSDENKVDGDMGRYLEQIFQNYYNSYKPSSPPEVKREDADVIRVHKYFEKEPGGPKGFSENYNEEDMGDLLRDLKYLGADNISLKDIQALQYYLDSIRNDKGGQEWLYAGPNDRQDLNTGRQEFGYDSRDWESDGKPAEWGSYDEAPAGSYENLREGEVGYPFDPEKEELLDKLKSGELTTGVLSDEEITDLINYINQRLPPESQNSEQNDWSTELQAKSNKEDDWTDSRPMENGFVGTEDMMGNEEEEGDRNEKLVGKVEGGKSVNSDKSGQLEYGPDKDGDQNAKDSKIPSAPEEETNMKEKKNMETMLSLTSKPRIVPTISSSTRDQPTNTKKPIETDIYWVKVNGKLNGEQAQKMLMMITKALDEQHANIMITNAERDEEKGSLTIRINTTDPNVPLKEVIESIKDEVKKELGLVILDVGIGSPKNPVSLKLSDDRYIVLSFVLCGCIAGILLASVIVFLIRRNSRSKQKLAQLSGATGEGNEPSQDYQDLCRQRMQGKTSEKPEPLHAASRIGSMSEQVRSPSSRSSTSSWSEEPVQSNMDISTGHIVLSYMEDHLKNKDRLDREWEGLCTYEADPSNTNIANDPANIRKNRYSDTVPYDHSRVILSTSSNASSSDYINASTITDHDPRNPAYIATQGPLPHTVADFWQMVWEQGSVVIVMLTRLTENGEALCYRYWPEEGSDLYHIYEVHLVSEHIWCDDYLVRSFYLKNLQTNETRTVTQFHYLTWPDLGVPKSIKALLDFRRKVNKSYRGRSCPIVVHCSDGCGRTGTYCLIDMVLNRMSKGAKEIDIAATLEHIRDQRKNTVKTKEQFQFALAAVAEEVHAILKALPQ
uniref:Receptor-type tyrosine-protein phosphatase N2-like n=1 Tax=Crassostrea virginica TaxID=6565 RepID=A0A8B8BU11_CRAVI|nr:receptor-type tyrosine-protein phosphatase N2-like [Crassostrea virginica]